MKDKNLMTLTSLKEWLNEKKTKKTNNKFTVSDVQGYIKRGKLPDYLGGNLIELYYLVKGVKTYIIK